MVIGSNNTVRDNDYARVTVDELILSNVDLTKATIKTLISDIL